MLKHIKTRDRGIMLERLDFDSLIPHFMKKAKEYNPEITKVEFANGNRAIYRSKYNTTYIIDIDGVGEGPLDPDDTYEVALNFQMPSTTRENSINIGTLPFPAVFRVAELQNFIVGEKIDLADYIRTFGYRLEKNFHLWYRILKDIEEAVTFADVDIVEHRRYYVTYRVPVLKGETKTDIKDRAIYDGGEITMELPDETTSRSLAGSLGESVRIEITSPSSPE